MFDLPRDAPDRITSLVGGIAVDGEGHLYLSFMGQHKVVVYTESGERVREWGRRGQGEGEFQQPGGIARDGKGRLYTTEGTLGRVQQFSAEGKPLLAWGDNGDRPGGFGALKTGYSKTSFGPVGVYVDRHDQVWISSLNDRVQLFTPEGKFLYGLGGTGEEPGEFARPHGMVMDSKGNLYVADAGNQRIQKFAISAP